MANSESPLTFSGFSLLLFSGKYQNRKATNVSENNHILKTLGKLICTSADPERGGGGQGSGPPLENHVI